MRREDIPVLCFLVTYAVAAFTVVWLSAVIDDQDSKIVDLQSIIQKSSLELSAQPTNGGLLGQLEAQSRKDHARQSAREH